MMWSAPSQSARWMTILIVFAAFGTFAMAGCIIEDFPLDNRKCNPNAANSCLDGWYCDKTRSICVKGTSPKPGENTPDETKKEQPREEVVQEPNPRDEVPQEVGDGGPDDGGVQETPPDTPQILKCKYARSNSNVSCPTPPSAGCNRFSQNFTRSNVALPTAVTGAAATVTPEVFSIAIDTTGTKRFLYVLGGSPTGSPGDKVLYSEVQEDGKLVEWKNASSLKTARAGAKAFWIKGAVYVVGGYDSNGKAIQSVERAVVKADGSLEAFQDIGTWSTARTNAGIAYQHGYFYFAGGNDGAQLSTKVERVLLKPDGRLGSFEVLESLSEGRTGPMVSTKYGLFLLGPNGSNRVLVAQLLSNGKVSPWCQSSVLPPDLVSLSALADVRRLFLYGIKSKTKVENLVYFGVLEEGKGDSQDTGGISSWYCSDHQTPANKALLLTPRTDAAAVLMGSYIIVIGGKDASGKALSSVEFGKLEYRKDGRCDLDLDGKTNSFDFCPHVFDDKNTNSDKPKKADGGELTSPRDPQWAAKDVQRFVAGDVCESDTMLFVPAGTFTRGSSTNTDEPLGPVSIDGFFVDKTEVTNKDYAACVRLGKCTEPKSKEVGDVKDYYGNTRYDLYPAVNLTWAQAKAYCEFRGKRLLTEAEWEKAARALAGAAYPWGNIAPDCKRSHFKDCKLKTPQTVGTLQDGASAYGAMDMSGNVREWVADFYSATAYKDDPKDNPKGPKTGTEHVVRGGSFLSDSTDIRVTKRDKLKPDEFKSDLGFRCAINQFPTVKAP